MPRCFSLAILSLGLFAVVPAHAQSADRSSIATVEAQWKQLTEYLTQVAEETSEADYAWQPVETVRSIGEMVGHVAGAQYLICAAALGDPAPDEDAVERSAKTKAALVAALKASTTYCAKAYAQTDKALQAPTEVFGESSTRFGALVLNATHNGEHYGNLITYLRIRGVVPPSSRPRSPAN